MAGVRRSAADKKSLLFCESRKLAEMLSSSLRSAGGTVFSDSVFAHHSSLSREEREYAEERFMHARQACIVCTSTMELGIDVGDLDAVLQVNAPATVSSFLQRLGRTGRRSGTVANTTLFVETRDVFLHAIAIVQLARAGWVESVRTNERAWQMMLHQIMALCLERGAIARSTPHDLLYQAACFRAITAEEVDDLVSFLVDHELLHDDGGSFSMGLAAEKAFGRRNFMALYSTFSSPAEFAVVGVSGSVIGTVQWDFLEKLLEQDTMFYLSGKPWRVERIEWARKEVRVVAATGGRVPKWSSMNPSFHGYEVTRMERAVLVSTEEVPFLQPDGQALLHAMRADRGELLSRAFAPMEVDAKGLTWHTYAGGYVNNTLRYALQVALGPNPDVHANNHSVRIKSEDIPASEVQRIIDRMSDDSYWREPTLLDQLISILPDYRLSKFQSYLPPEYARQLVADTILDIPNTVRFLREEEPMEIYGYTTTHT